MDKHRIAAIFKRSPWMGVIGQKVYRLWQPRITAGVVGAVFNEKNELLVVQHVFHPIHSWGLPGGWMGRHEEPVDTIKRELFEETGLTIETRKPLIINCAKSLSNHLDIAYLCFVRTTDPIRLSVELLDFRWLSIDEIFQMPLSPFHSRVINAAVDEIRLGALT